MSAVAEDPVVAACRDEWADAVSVYLDAATAVPRTPGHLIFHQNHMMSNRLGILPREEALLGLIAAQT